MVPDVELFAQSGLGSVLVDRFVHFSTPAAAGAIVESRRLELSRTIPNAVFAVAVGARSVPGVQHSRGGSREVAVLFAAELTPAQWFCEEVIWRRRTPLPITPLAVLEADAADALLDGSLQIPDDGWWHRSECGCVQCATRLETLRAAA